MWIALFAKCSKINYTSRENIVVVSFVCWFIVTDTIKRYSEKKMMDNFVCGFTVTMNTTKRHVKTKSCIILFADLLYRWPLQNVTGRRSRVQFCLLIYCTDDRYKTSREDKMVDNFVCWFIVKLNTIKRHVKAKSWTVLFADQVHTVKWNLK